MSELAGNGGVLQVVEECQLEHCGGSNLSTVMDLKAECTSLFGRKICGREFELPSGLVGVVNTREGEMHFSRVKVWKPDNEVTEGDQFPQLMKYQQYISKMHLAS